mgnify:CR=1 FL=1
MNAIILQPTDALPLWFHGRRLAACSSRRRVWDDAWFAERWFEFEACETAAGDFVLAIGYDCIPRWMDEDDVPHLTVYRCRNLRELHRRLNDHDYERYVRVNYTPCDRYDLVEVTQMHVDELVFDARIAGRVVLEAIRD